MSSSCILRIWKGRGSVEGVRRYCDEHFAPVVLPELETIPGFLGARVLTRSADSNVDLIVATEWRSLDAVRAFAGDEIERAVVEPIVHELLATFDEYVRHFEVAVAANSPPDPG